MKIKHIAYNIELNQSPSQILEFLQFYDRQIMNITQMPLAYLIIAKNEDTIVGVMGLDFTHSVIPESFSHFVVPGFRSQQISYHLEYLCFLIAKQFNQHRLFLRSSSRDQSWINQKRLADPSYTVITHFAGIAKTLCEKCAFYQNECQVQTFFEIDAPSRLLTLESKLSAEEKNKLNECVRDYFHEK